MSFIMICFSYPTTGCNCNPIRPPRAGPPSAGGIPNPTYMHIEAFTLARLKVANIAHEVCDLTSLPLVSAHNGPIHTYTCTYSYIYVMYTKIHIYISYAPDWVPGLSTCALLAAASAAASFSMRSPSASASQPRFLRLGVHQPPLCHIKHIKLLLCPSRS